MVPEICVLPPDWPLLYTVSLAPIICSRNNLKSSQSIVLTGSQGCMKRLFSLDKQRLWKGTELGTIHIAAFCTHPFPYHIRHIMELFCIGGGNAGEQQEVTKVNIWNTQLISGREISTI